VSDAGGRGRTRDDSKSSRSLILVAGLLLAFTPGCATMRLHAPSPDLRPCSDGFAYTADGWRLGVRHFKPVSPDPDKLPVVLCHGLGLNATFWTITDPQTYLPAQLTANGYEVFVFDFRGSGQSAKVGPLGQLNAGLRQTPFLEYGECKWTVDEIITYDVPAVLDYIKAETGADRVNWIGHSLGGMLMFAYLEVSPEPWRIANFVAMGSSIVFADRPETRYQQQRLLRANRGLQKLARVLSTGRLGRPLMFMRIPGLDKIDQFYFTAANVDRTTVSRFYGYTLEDTGCSALKQLDPYLALGRFYSADRSIDYVSRLDEVQTPLLMVVGDGDIMSDVPSSELTFNAVASKDKLLMRFGRAEGHVADYGHCDLVWSRYAPKEVFLPIIAWLDEHRNGPQTTPQSPSPLHSSNR